MPPQTNTANTNPDYDFILKDQQQPKKGLGLPGSGLPKTVKIIIGVVVGFFVVIVLYSVLAGHKTTNSDQLVAVMGRAQEISRVSALVQQQSKDTNTLNLAATTAISLSSDQSQLTDYLKKNHKKVSPNQLLLYKNKDTDTELQSAQQNNNLESYYVTYLKKELNTYHDNLASAFASAGQNGKAILQNSNGSVEILLSSPQLKTS